MITQWNPSEIIIHRKVLNDPVTRSILEKCKGIPFKFVNGADPKSVVQASEILSATPNNMLDKIIAGKQVLFVAPASNHTVDTFSMPDDRIPNRILPFAFLLYLFGKSFGWLRIII